MKPLRVAAVDLPYIPPELRENDGEIEAAERGALPRLIEQRDLVADLRLTVDPRADPAQVASLVERAAGLGLSHVALVGRFEGNGERELLAVVVGGRLGGRLQARPHGGRPGHAARPGGLPRPGQEPPGLPLEGPFSPELPGMRT